MLFMLIIENKSIKEKIKKIIFIIAEAGTVIWAVSGIMSHGGLLPVISGDYNVGRDLAYFLSAALVLYLLRKYEGKH